MELRKACEHGKFDECNTPLFTLKTRRLAGYCPGGEPVPATDQIVGLVADGFLTPSPDQTGWYLRTKGQA